ncbi:MAG: ABC transporter substrate-binding protein [Chloroflexota bacterium]|nr:ABC transporter substrate-binding protein [Chloroflexota bacterium]
MKCPKCQTENPEVAEFCLKCGVRLVVVCAECGTALPGHAAFCFACGAPVGAPPVEREEPAAPDAVAERLRRLVPKEFAERLLATRGKVQAERRRVTILFSDVKGSTAMGEGLDPEDVMEIMDGAFDVLIEPIVRYEGTVTRLMGDAVLAFFGAPIAHEDDPERACRAALEIVEGAQAYAERLDRERGIAGFSVRAGINTGLVVVGEVGSDLRVEYTAMGDAINLAARLESAAEPGTVLVTEHTHRSIAPLFETEAMGPVKVKGRAEPISTYRVLAARAGAGWSQTSAGLDPPLVGREKEFGALQSAVERLRAGVGGIVTVVGEAGIGKSRLVAEVRRQALSEGSKPLEGTAADGRTGFAGRSGGQAYLNWVEGRCLSYGTSIAYLLWLDVLRDLLGLRVDDPPDVVRDALRNALETWCPDSLDKVYPYLARLMSLPPESETEIAIARLDGERLKRGTFHAVEELIGCAADSCPLVLVCEDLHWADPTSVELLERVLGLTDRRSLLVVCVSRPRPSHGSWRLRETAARLYRHRHSDLWIEPLSAAASERLVDALLQLAAPGVELVEGLPQKLRWRILGRAEGNPFYVEEVVRSLTDSGAIAPDEASGRWRVTQDVTDIPIPETVQGVLTARIDRLDEENRRVLQIASVIGRIFWYRVLAEVAATETVAWTEPELQERLLDLQREELIRERVRLPELEYIFEHELTRDAAYRGLLRKDRRLFHRQVAEALERLFPERVEEQLGLLAHHWERAGVAAKAVTYLLRAGDQARMVYAHEEAVDYYQRALVFLREQGEDKRLARTLMKLGLVHTAALHAQKAREAYDEGFGLWERGRPAEERCEPGFRGAVLRFAVEEPLTLDPGRAADDVSAFITGQLFEGLVEVDEDYNVLPAAADRWEIDRDGTRYLFMLREGVCWNDGTRLTASDFERAWKRNLDPATGSPLAHLLYCIENGRALGEGAINDSEEVGVTAVDDRTLEVRTEGPTAYFLHLLAHPVAYPLPQTVLEEPARRQIDPDSLVSNGPYELVAWERGKKIVLDRNPSYGGRFPGNAIRVECSIFTDFGPVLEAYGAGAVDAISLINSDAATIARAQATYGDELVLTPQLSTLYLVFRVDRSPFDDVQVRKAFAHAVDRQALAEGAWHGQYIPATGGFVPPGMPGHSGGIGLLHNPSRARDLLSQAGYPRGRGFPEITLAYSAGSGREPVASFLRSAWRRHLDLRVRGQNLEWRAFMDLGSRDPADVALWGWLADYPDPDNLLRVTFHSTEGFNTPRWHNPRFDALVEQAAQVADGGRRLELYREADRILVAEEAVVMPLGYGRGRILVKPWVALPSVPPALLRLKDVSCCVAGHEEREE